jgi:hypothetical protein
MNLPYSGRHKARLEWQSVSWLVKKGREAGAGGNVLRSARVLVQLMNDIVGPK